MRDGNVIDVASLPDSICFNHLEEQVEPGGL
jgi:hypothetical protein